MEIQPFRAFRFDEKVVGDVGSCIAPPYDVISPAQQHQLYRKSKYNIVRVTKGRTTPFDNNSNNQYTRAADYFNTWIKKGVLKQDLTDAIYAYVQDFQLADKQFPQGNRSFQRSSFISLAKLEPLGKTVRPHEQTFDEPKIDRLNLKRATVAKFGLVFMLYEDQKGIADKIVKKSLWQKPVIDFLDEQGVRHRIFAITDKHDIDAIAKMMRDKTCIIADGHHRYETALNYYKETANPFAAYQMIAFVNTCRDGLIILATHRLVKNLEHFDIKELLTALKQSFKITEYRFDSPQSKIDAEQKMLAKMKAEYHNDKNAFGIYGGNNAFYTTVLIDNQAMDSLVPNMSPAWRSLDVSVLHKLVFERLLGIREWQLAEGSNIEYVKDTETAIDGSIAKVDTGEIQAAFFLNAAKMKQIENVTSAGEKMPQKSTYFYPKMYTGLTINKL